MKFKELRDLIFSVKEYSENTNIMRIFGIKFKYLKPEYAEKLKKNKYDEYRRKKTDITTLPKADGQLRDIQLASLALLKELDYVCRQSNLKYWLDFGTLLGAVRHKGFIPWDDDIDVSMMREDYKKIEVAFKKCSRNPDIYAEQTYLGKGQSIIKVKHKKFNFIFVDIFPHDYLNEILSEKERFLRTKELKNLRKKLNSSKEMVNSEKITEKIMQLNKDILKSKKIENSDIICGLEYFYSENLWIHSYETIFPLKEIDFEGFSAMCINQPEKYLTDIFKDYMAYPKKISIGHGAYAKISEEDKKTIQEIIKEDV